LRDFTDGSFALKIAVERAPHYGAPITWGYLWEDVDLSFALKIAVQNGLDYNLFRPPKLAPKVCAIT
jgi:hypothetical protein